MKLLLIHILLHFSLYTISTTEKQDFVKQTKHNDNIVNSQTPLRLNERNQGDRSKTDKTDAQTRHGIIWLMRQRREEKQERRHQRMISHGRRACSKKRSVLYEARDEFGDTVQIAPFIGDEGKVRQQIIYETYCDKEHCECRGVNNGYYESACETNYKMVYARVIKAGKMNWSSVKVRAGCSCIVREKHFSHVLEAIW